MKKKPLLKIISALIFVAISIISCKTLYLRNNYNNVNQLIHQTHDNIQAPYLKAHFKNGDVCIFNDKWTIDTAQNTIKGNGILYDFNRNVKFGGLLTVPVDSIAIFETNKRITDPNAENILALSILAGLDVGLGIYCVSNPKACFGSCPTFYINPNENFHHCDAEGFSSSILPSLEKGDIDDLNYVVSGKKSFSLYMKNEALETQCINKLILKAVPVNDNENAYISDVDKFYLTGKEQKLNKAFIDGDDITYLLVNADKNELFSGSDPRNMAAKEEIILEFNNTERLLNPGLILHFRQSLMTTYIFYNTMGYMGNMVGDMFTKLETNNKTAGKYQRMQDILGGIEVYLWKNGKWIHQGSINEAGPIAINKEIVKLKDSCPDGEYKIKLKMTKGFWRIDYAVLTNIKSIEKAIDINLQSITKMSKTNEKILKAVVNNKSYIISMPGDMYKLDFKLPDQKQKYKLFLYSKGYYLEWMRQNWIEDQNIAKLKYMIDFPEKYFKTEASEYKKYEDQMEEIFWESKIDCNDFSYYDVSLNK